jgi:uncharacterized membrane protein YfcA
VLDCLSNVDTESDAAQMMILSALLFGVAIGLLLGLIGGGGSILTVPILVYIIRLTAHEATTTALVIVGVTALAGAAPHAVARRVDLRLALFFGISGIVGAFAGAWGNHLLPGKVVLLLFGALMVAVATLMFKRQRATPRSATPEPPHIALRPTLVAGLAVGLLTGFFGVGGGFLIVPALTLALKLPMQRAIGTSLVIIAINSVAAFVAHLRYGHADLRVSILFIIGGMLGAYVGSRSAGRLPERQLAAGFSAFVAALGVWLIVRNAGIVNL